MGHASSLRRSELQVKIPATDAMLSFTLLQRPF
jgi:hypothetical protein